MATKEVQYAGGAEGYNAMVSDFKELFDWDAVEPDESGGNFTLFKKSCGDKAYVGLRVQQNVNGQPQIHAINNNGTNSFATAQNATNSCINVAYASGNGFFAFCGNPTPLPGTSDSNIHWGGISTCRNLLTGETSWCSFIRAWLNGSGIRLEPADYFLLSKDTKETSVSSATQWCLTTYAKIGAAAALYEPRTGFVTDRVMLLTAIPDNYFTCLAPVVFNGIRYNRLGMMLVPE